MVFLNWLLFHLHRVIKINNILLVLLLLNTSHQWKMEVTRCQYTLLQKRVLMVSEEKKMREVFVRMERRVFVRMESQFLRLLLPSPAQRWASFISEVQITHFAPLLSFSIQSFNFSQLTDRYKGKGKSYFTNLVCLIFQTHFTFLAKLLIVVIHESLQVMNVELSLTSSFPGWPPYFSHLDG